MIGSFSFALFSSVNQRSGEIENRIKPEGFSPFEVGPWSTILQQVITGHACGERVAIIGRAIGRPRMSGNYMKTEFN